MASIAEQCAAIDAYVRQTWANCRVVPDMPPDRAPKIGRDDPDDFSPDDRDELSGWSFFIVYRDAGGDESQRRVTVRRFEQMPGAGLALSAWCHERLAPRKFLCDRVVEVVSLDDGELHHPPSYFDWLQKMGVPITDSGMAALGTILLFLGRCDGRVHHLEWPAIEHGLARYALRFGGDDAMVGSAYARVRNMAPDAKDFRKALHKVRTFPADGRGRFIALTKELCAEVIDADGVMAPQEFMWGAGLDRIFDMLTPAD